MQCIVFTGRLAANPQIAPDDGKAVFRLLESRGTDSEGRSRVVGVNCVSWMKGLNRKVIAPGLAKGCEAIVAGVFVDSRYTARDGTPRTAKELVVQRLTVLDWADTPAADPESETAEAAPAAEAA